MNKKEIKEWNKYLKYSNLRPSKKELDDFLNNATEEDKLRCQLQSYERNINGAMLSTCEVYGLGGNCGKNCPKFKDKTCEEYLTTLENEYNSLKEENESLRKLIQDNTIFIKDKETGNYQELNINPLELEKYKSRIDEALEYINNNTYYKTHKGTINADDLYIILKGGDK